MDASDNASAACARPVTHEHASSNPFSPPSWLTFNLLENRSTQNLKNLCYLFLAFPSMNSLFKTNIQSLFK